MTPEEVAGKLKEFQSQIDTMKKDYDLKLDAATKDAQNWKTVAEQNQAQAKKFEADVEKERKEKQELSKRAAETENRVFIEKQKEAGKIVPAQEELVTRLMETMSHGEVVKFKEADGSETSHTQLSLLKKFIESLEPKISFETFSGGSIQSKQVPNEVAQEQFMKVKTANGEQMLPVRDVDLATKAFEYMEQSRKAGTPVSYGDALIALSPRKAAAR